MAKPVTVPEPKKAYPSHEEWGVGPTADEELEKAHLHIFHCSEFALKSLLKAGHRVVKQAQIRRIIRQCPRRGASGELPRPTSRTASRNFMEKRRESMLFTRLSESEQGSRAKSPPRY